jgi:hypothetical protein
MRTTSPVHGPACGHPTTLPSVAHTPTFCCTTTHLSHPVASYQAWLGLGVCNLGVRRCGVVWCGVVWCRTCIWRMLGPSQAPIRRQGQLGTACAE